MKYLNHLADLRCTHGGKVQPHSPGTRAFKVDDSPILCAEDLAGALIAGCPQAGPGITPCTSVVTILLGRARGATADGMTPLLETLMAMTNGVPPGMVQVMSPGASSAQTLDVPSTGASNGSSAGAGSAAPALVGVGPASPGKTEQLSEGTVIEWYEYWLQNQGAAGGVAAMHAERLFFLPELDSSIPIREGFSAATSWEGYHAAKHGVFERFQNAKGEMVNMGKLFFDEEYRWIRPEFRESPNKLTAMAEARCNELAGKFSPNPKKALRGLEGMIDSQKFTDDIAAIARSRLRDPKSSIWQARYGKGPGARLQTNVDFEAHGLRWRLALDPETGRALNFFRIDPKLKPQPYYEIVVRWMGKATDAKVHSVPGSSFRVEVSAKWSGLLRQGMKAGATSGSMASAFLGSIDGFRQEGIPGAMKGLAIGAISGAVIGAGVGAMQTLVMRVLPWLERALTVAGWFGTVAAVLLDSTATALEPPEFGERHTDEAGNEWAFRNVVREGGPFFPKYRPRGIRIRTPGGIVIHYGEERPHDSSYSATPITVYASSSHEVQWQMMRTPEGSSLWWWHDLASSEQYIVTYADDEQMQSGLARAIAERGYRFGDDGP